MILEIIPKALYSRPNISPLLIDGRSSVLHKTLGGDLVGKEIYISTPLIVYILKGKQIIERSDLAATTIPENHLLFLPKDLYLVSDYVRDGWGEFEAILFFLDERVIEKYLQSSAAHYDQPIRSSTQVLFTTPATPQILRFIDALKQVYGDGHQSHDLLELKLLELLHLLAIQDGKRSFLTALTKFNKPNGKRDIRSFMEKHYTSNLKLEDYAQLTGRSLSTFIRDFKQAYKATPNQWIIEKRLEKARELLTAKNLSVREVASEVGYDNVSYFIRAFKKKYGVTPKQEQSLGIA
ncbi:helix-turn-helix domain-containing protein [Marinobacter nitratireducens]|uniref:helix-turn-helix domain-containing protein n=1 Tax=Marinobacter nitratireducens TaxID=1137280 RepID=UPI0005648BCC|nr:AraC family transcriptional regulator [Marinobacter nitratireducens]